MITPSFFMQHPEVCARELVGALFEWDGCRGRVIETEAYAAEGDPACHTFSRPSARDFVERHPAGTAYVYLNYGVHWLFNVLVKGDCMHGFVLLRALEPLSGLEAMRRRRGCRRDTELCAGPGRLTQALGIEGSSHGTTFLELENRGFKEGTATGVSTGPRIGISRGKELPWRFTEGGNPHLSGPIGLNVGRRR